MAPQRGLLLTVCLVKTHPAVSANFWPGKSNDWLTPEDILAAFLPRRNLSAAATKKEPILGLLEDLDVEVEPSRPVDWTVSECALPCYA